ncbi:MAG: peptidoglycan DD-metalloendopeptidase family protein [Methylobacter sp.]|uniref:Peptidoglycan DD-metalloendopeptidase family protein n=1 Tax=Candidatus Methylobacter titanis TaxID=3053457 RepID=A0AA43TJ61_9GAMM|nr:peptidoglycan DD-metalloendopeptidase family protein [Candidatus Methylobacter titanis]
MKKKIYTSMLFGISVAFSVAGHTQTKPISKSTTAKTVHTVTVHSKNTKTVNKKSIVAAVKSTPNSKKTAVTSKSANKKNAATASKIATQKKSITKKQAVVPTKLKNNKQSVVAKSARNNKALISTKSKHNKQAIASAKSKHTSHPAVAFEPARRQHIFIASKSLKPVLGHKERQKHVPAELNLGNTRTDQIIQTNNDKQLHPITFNRPQTIKTNTAHVSIETSLFLDGLEVGLSKELILQLTDIFAWDIDFATNLRPGDQFTIVYGKKIVNGTETDSDDIIAAEFVNQGSSYTAIRYIDKSGTTSYYSPDGQSMQRAFLSTPVDFIKISSHFDMHRKHPILNRIRAHKGIDYAARTGTPVKTTGDGIVTFSGRKGAYGQVVIIQHNDHYETLYAHMSGFKKGLTAGNHVKQGDVIGYVGQSGLATGPHLHYEFHVDGLYRDPETVKIPHSMPISSALLTDFKAQTQPFYAQLNQTKAKSLFAKNQEAIAPDIALPPASIRSSRYD